MADVFISYSRLDQEQVKPIAERLQSLGYTIWWDKPERGRQAPRDQRERELDASRVVIVVWSTDALSATQVQAEAARALDAGKLLPLKIEPVAPPPPFNVIEAFDVTGAAAWGPLEQALAQRVRGAESAVTQSGTLGPLPVLSTAGAPKLVTFALIASLAAYAMALSATFNGVMAPAQLQITLAGILCVTVACTVLAGFRLFASLRAGG